MAEIDPVVLELRAELGRYKAELRSTTTDVERLLGRQEKSARRLEAEMKRSSGAIGNTIKGLATTFAAAFTGRELVGLVDNFTRLQNALRVAGLEGEELARVQERLFALGAQYGVSVNALADLYGKAEQAGRELGASQADLIDLTTAVSQSILITGTTTEQARGAILGLTQALSSGTVRAEEFNQINEGGLRPLLEAAAASERFGGSIAKLRAEVVDGTVSSQEFYQAILDGATLVETKASTATLTLSGAFQSLTDQLSKYFGEAGQGSGATEALAAAIGKLADNLDVIIPAIAVIATAIGIKMVGAAILGTNAMFALTAAIGGAATATEALAFATSGLAAALPLVALTAVVAAIGLIAVKAGEATEATEKYKRALNDSEAAQDKAREAAERLASAHGKSRREALDAAKAERELTKQKLAGARASLVEAEAELKRARAFQAAQNQASFGSTGLPGTGGFIQGFGDRETAQARANVSAQQEAIDNFEAAIESLNASINGLEPSRVSASSEEKKGKKSRAASGPTEEEIAFRQEQELARLRGEEIQARLALTKDANERADLERELLEIERDSRIADIQANSDLSKEQKAAQIAIIEKLYGVAVSVDEQGNIIANGNRSLYALYIEQERRAQIEREQAEIAEARGQNELEQLRLQYELASTQDQRRELALRILEVEDRLLRSKLQEIIASETAEAAEKKRAQIILDGLEATSGARREAVRRSEAGAFERYARSLEDPKQRVEEAVVRQLERVNDGITDAISKAIGVEDPLIKDLLDILLQEILFKPIAQALANAQGGGGGGGGLDGIFGAIGGLFGGFRASGGPVSSGRAYVVGERGPELFVPEVSGSIVPNNKMGGGVVRVVIEEAPGFAARVRAEAEGVAVEVTRQSASQIVDAAANETLRRASRPTL